MKLIEAFLLYLTLITFLVGFMGTISKYIAIKMGAVKSFSLNTETIWFMISAMFFAYYVTYF